METLGEKLRTLRDAKRKTQAEVAQAIGVHKSSISFWELDINEPKAGYIKKLAQYFGVSADYLIGLENEDGTKISKE